MQRNTCSRLRNHSLFTADTALIAQGTVPLRIVIAALPLVGMQVIGAMYFQAAGKTVPALLLGLSRQILFLISLAIIMPRILGLTGVWTAFPTADVLASVVTGIWLLRDTRRLKQESIENNPSAMAAEA